ncbi:MAG: archease [Candidatus Bipolaricaulota bacterium]|nr:archease [Candidatus Bipolaricaulota bacterium]
MPFVYLDHTADLAIRAWGSSIGEAFAQAALAMFSKMIRTDRVRPMIAREYTLQANSLRELLVAWLAALLVPKDVEDLVFSRFDVDVHTTELGFELCGRALGEPLDAGHHEPSGEVKGITYLGLDVREETGVWYAEFVADV